VGSRRSTEYHGPVSLLHIPMSGDRARLAARDHAVTITKPFTERDLAGASDRAMQTSYQPAR